MRHCISYCVSIILALVLTSGQTRAEVVEKSPSHFVIEISSSVKVSAGRAYAQFTRIGEWWNAEHSWFGSAQNFSLNLSAGGCFCEIDGERQVMHMTVSLVSPNSEVRMLGGLGPLQMMAVNGAMSWRFVPINDAETEVVQRYTVLGNASQNLDSLAPIVDAVQQEQQNRLVHKLLQ